MDNEHGVDQTDKRRSHLVEVMRQAALRRMKDVVEPIETVMVDKPLLDEEEFGELLAEVALKHKLNEEQQHIIWSIYGRFKRNIELMSEYRDLVTTNGNSPNPLEDIAGDREAMRQLLIDIGVEGLEETVMLSDFKLDTKIPGYAAIYYVGDAGDLYSATKDEERNAGGWLFYDLESEEGEPDADEKNKRLALLNHKVALIVEQRNEKHTTTFEETKRHELLHYLFELYMAEKLPRNRDEYLDYYVRDEIRAYFESQEKPRIGLDNVLPDEYSKMVGGGKFVFMNHINQWGDIFEVMFELERLNAEDTCDGKEIGWAAMVSEDLVEMKSRLATLGDHRVVKSILAMGEMGSVCREDRNWDQVLENLNWMGLWMERVGDMELEGEDLSLGLRVMQMRLGEFVNDKLLGLVGRDQIETQTPRLLTEFRKSKPHWMELFGEADETYGEMEARIKKQFNRKRKSEKEEELWVEFLAWAEESNVEQVKSLAERYQNVQGRKMHQILELRKLKAAMQDNFQTWIDHTKKREYLEKEELA